MHLSETKYKKITWYNLQGRGKESIAYLRENFKFHELDFEDCLNNSQRSKVDVYRNYNFFILILPLFNKKTKRIESTELNVFISKNYIVTLHRGNIKEINSIQKDLAKDHHHAKEYFQSGTIYFLYLILDRILLNCMNIIDDIGIKIDLVEKNLFNHKETTSDMLQNILTLKRNLMRFKRIIKPQNALLFELKQKKAVEAKFEIYYDDLNDEVYRILDMLNTHIEIVDTLLETNEALSSYRTNNIIRILTVFSVLLLPLTFITGIYGMNITDLPFAREPHSFFIIICGMLVILLVLLFLFKRKKWL